MAELKGIYPILATPFQSSGELDENSFERLIEFLVVSGVHGLTLFGLAGEYYKLSDDERRICERYLETAQAFLAKALRFGHPGLVVPLLYLLLLGKRAESDGRIGATLHPAGSGYA